MGVQGKGVNWRVPQRWSERFGSLLAAPYTKYPQGNMYVSTTEPDWSPQSCSGTD